MLSLTLSVAVPPPPPPPPSYWRGRVRLHLGYLGIPAIFQLVCHAFLSITFAFSGYSRSVEARDFAKTKTKFLKTQTAMNTKTEKPTCFGTKTEKPIWKIAKPAKPKIPMPPLCRSGSKDICTLQHGFLCFLLFLYLYFYSLSCTITHVCFFNSLSVFPQSWK